MKILIVHFRDICDFPPVQNLIDNVLSLGHEVTLISFDRSGYCEIYGNRLQVLRLDYWPGRFRSAVSYNKNIQTIKSFTKQHANEFDLLWTTTDSTVAAMGGLIDAYSRHVMQLMELTEDCAKIPHVKLFKAHLPMYGKKAWKLVVPEYNRAEILSVWWGLDRKPYILPNKSNLDADGAYFLEKTTQGVIQSVKDCGLKIILYQGIFTPERRLDEIAEYLERKQTKYVLCVMGPRNEYVDTLCKKFKSVRYLPYIPSPNHLAVTRQADIGLLSYDPQNGWTGCSKLNALYCAPNKIFEFTKFGIPILGNDIPGLLYPVEMNHIGAVCNFNLPESIKNALDFISDNYTSLCGNCLNFFASVDTTDIVRKILDEDVCAKTIN